METLKTYLEALQFACNSKACAPPPVGTGGSNDSGGGGGDAVRKARMVAQARAEASGESWRPNVDRGTPGASRVAEDAGEIMAKISKLSRDDELPGEEHGQDQLMSALYEARGFNKQAEQLDAEDFEQFLKDNADTHIEGWRGVDVGSVPAPTNEYQQERQARIAMSFHEGERHWAGRGVLGNGTYVATNHPDSENGFQKSVHESYGYSAKTNPVQIHMAIPKEGLTTYTQMESVGLVISRLTRSGDAPSTEERNMTPQEILVRGAQSRMGDRWETITEREVAMGMEVVRQGLEAGMSLSQIETVTRDAGRLSTIIGFDGLTTSVPGIQGDSQYTVIHNRGAIVLDHTIYTTRPNDPKGEYPRFNEMSTPQPHPTWNDESQRSR